MSRPLILISNDDGLDAKGIHFLADCVSDFAEVVVVAPDGPRSGQSAALTVNGPLRITEHPDYNGAKMLAVSGTPVDCVKLALHNVLDRKPDLMLSGVNHGSNAGASEIYSGTMGAVFEATMQGIPAIGYSLLSHSLTADFSETRPFIVDITRKVLQQGLPQGICLNVNFPAKVKIEGCKVVRAARSRWTEEYESYVDPHGRPFFWLTGTMLNEEPDATDTDLYWLSKNYGSIVPSNINRNSPEAVALLSKQLGY